MLSKLRNKILIIILLGLISGGTYYVQFLIFHNEKDTFFYLLQDLAFVPIQVITVTLILNQVVNMVETKKKIKKTNVIISSFFIEIGTPIMKIFSQFNSNQAELVKLLNFSEFDRNSENVIKRQLVDYQYQIHVSGEELHRLYMAVKSHKGYLLQMLTNSSLLEHDSFTDMLWSVFHIIDELQSREMRLLKLPKEDLEHLSADILRGYSAMIVEWVQYMRYLHDEYPYLYKTEVGKIPYWIEKR